MSNQSIFPKGIEISALNEFNKGCLIEHLGIVFTEITDDCLIATMPVDQRTKQPLGLLHGGASVALAETLGSQAAVLVIDITKQHPVGLEINTNHIRSAKGGFVTGTASPVHIGRSTHVWNITIEDEQKRTVAVSRITIAILDNK